MVAGWCMAPRPKSRKVIHGRGLRSHFFRRPWRGVTKKPPRQSGGGNPLSEIADPNLVAIGSASGLAAAVGGLGSSGRYGDSGRLPVAIGHSDLRPKRLLPRLLAMIGLEMLGLDQS